MDAELKQVLVDMETRISRHVDERLDSFSVVVLRHVDERLDSFSVVVLRHVDERLTPSRSGSRTRKQS